MRLKPGYQLLILAAVVLAVYYPALSAGINSVDDPHIIAAYETVGVRTFAGIFRPATSYYYRPLVELSYYLDNFFWTMHPRFMHLENMLLHTLNAVLVFCLARQLAEGWSVRAPWFPLAGSLLFALHPVNSESVIWIAGRTDPLAALFILAALCCLLKCLIADRIGYLWPALLLFALGLLAKEIAFCFLPVALLLTAVWPRPLLVRRRLLSILAGVCACGALLLLVLANVNRSLSMTAALINSGSFSEGVTGALTAFGFYLKKLFFPLPLNFAIDVVSPLYLYPGLLFFLLLPFLLRKKELWSVLTLACAIFLLPALLVSIKKVAWTPYAERYLYLSSVFFCLTAAGGLGSLQERLKSERWLFPLALCAVVGAGLVTLQRAFLWQDNLALYRDTVRKSPGFGAAHLELATALLRKGNLREGRIELEAAERLNKRPSIKYPIKASLMSLLLLEGHTERARDYFYTVFTDKRNADTDFLNLLATADTRLAQETPDTASRNAVYAEVIDTYDTLYKKTAQPFYLYLSGKTALQAGDETRAISYLRQVVRVAPPDTHYTAAASKMLRKLEVGR